MNTIIYIRTSTDEQEPENQIKSCQNLSNEEYELLQDKQSAFTDKKDREGFERAKKLIKTRNIKHFIVWDLDRIYRNRKRLKEFFQFCKIYGCSIHSVNQQWLEELHKIPEPFNEIMHELMLNLMGWLGEDESKKKSKRVKLAVRRVEGKPTKSYKGNKWGRKSMHTNKINRIKKLIESGMTYREIANVEKVSIGKISKISNVHKYTLKNKEKKPLDN